MKIKCIDNKYWEDSLTVGRLYEVISIYDDVYRIIDDKDNEDSYWKERFKPLSEVRNETINKLLEYENKMYR